jgi:3-oxoacyl-[acyl-carrier protein] reductase
MTVSLSLDGKVALVTGGSRGIGAAVVRLFAAAGAKVLFNYQKSSHAADQLVSECGTTNVRAVRCDLSGTGTAQELVQAAITQFGRLDVLVANHGVWPSTDMPIDEMPDDQWRSTIDINLNSVFALIKYSVAQLKRQARNGTAGHIVLVSSTAGQRGEAFHCDYAASKGALISMVKGLSTELIRDRIYVNCVAPGWVDTDMSAPVLADPVTSKTVLDTIPLGRMATPDEIAGPILFLCTKYAGFITGEILNVNGGAVLAG